MKRIQILETHIANRIAAGEVVERPASVVKELVENAIDAGATSICIEVQGGGLEYIRVTDNGCGIPPDEAVIAFARHATSKIRKAEDLEEIGTLGFRGEALSSIAAVSQLTMRSCEKGAELGVCLRFAGGECKENAPAGCPEGTTFEVENLFYNVPARQKFLKSARTEASYITDYMARMLIAYPFIAFKLIQNGRTIYQSTGDGELKNAIFTVYGAEVLPHLKPIDYDDGYMRLTGFVGTERIARSNRAAQSFFVNERYIRAQRLSFAVQFAFDTRLMTGKFPFIVLDIRISGREVDPNVHPNKLEIRFKDEDRVVHTVTRAVRNALAESIMEVPEFQKQDVQLGSHTFWQVGKAPGPAEEMAEEEARIAVSEALNSQKAPQKVILRERDDQELQVPREAIPHVAVHVKPREQQQPSIVPTRISALEDEFQVIGQLFSCYWVITQGDTVFFIDQHAAHERIIYEKLMESGLQAQSQMLLLPQILRLSAGEYDTLMENLDVFKTLGFSIEEFGPLTVSLRAVPHIVGEPQTAAFLRDALTFLQNKNRISTVELKREAIIQSACKHAVKAGDHLHEEEIRALLREFTENGVPMTCPHGRPVMVGMRKNEFEKLFKRSV